MMNLSDREMIKIINQQTRQSPYFKTFNRLRYKSPKGYIDYDRVTFEMAKLRTCYQMASVPMLKEDKAQLFSLTVLEQAYQQGFAPFCLDEKLFDAFFNSHLPQKGLDIKRVIPVGLLLFPSRLKNPDGQYIRWIGFSHRLASEKSPIIQLTKDIIEFEHKSEDSLSWFTILEDNSQYAEKQSLEKLDPQLTHFSDDFFVSDALQEVGQVNIKAETAFGQKVTEILIQTLLYLQLKPKEAHMIQADRVNQQNNRLISKKQRLVPHIIGQDYHFKTHYETTPPILTQQRSSPATHWRSGHWRYQPYGSRDNPQYKLKWIEPMLINQ